MVSQKARMGFSLLELTVVLVIVSLLSTLGILTYANMQDRSQAHAGAKRIAATCAAARQHAIAANAPHQVFFSLAEGMFWIDELDASGNVARRQIETPGHLPEFVVFESFVVNGVATGAETATVRFWPDGHGDTATIVLGRSVGEGSNETKAHVRVFGPTGMARSDSGEPQQG